MHSGHGHGCGYNGQLNTLFVTLVGRATLFYKYIEAIQFFAKFNRFVALITRSGIYISRFGNLRVHKINNNKKR